MKRLKSKTDIEKSEKKKKFIVGIILISLMLFSTAGFALTGLYGGNSGGSGDEGDLDGPYYNGQYWVYPVGGVEYYFSNNKEEVNIEIVSIDRSLFDYSGKNLYIDSKDSSVLNEIYVNLGRYTGRVQEACYGECERDLPEKDCSENLIKWEQSDQERIYEEENCVFIEGSLKTLDAFLFKILNI
jgi:hypothetical protein